MFNSTVVEVAIGLILIYLVLGLICTSINEYIAQLLGLRAENLVEAIYGLFTGPDRHLIAEDIYDHPLVRSLCRKQWGFDFLNGKRFAEIDKLPSSIPPPVFSSVLIDLLKQDAAKADPHDRYDEETLSILRPILDSARRDLTEAASQFNPPPAVAISDVLEKAKAAIEEWYGHALQRAGGWYKRRTQVMSLMVATCLVLAINADTISIYQRLSDSQVERTKLTAYATSLTNGNRDAASTAESDPEVSQAIKSGTLDFLGWAAPRSADPRRVPIDFWGWMYKLFGLAITAFAASLGAPFWFDVLSKFMTVRSGGDPNPGPGDKKKAAAQGAVS